MKIAHFHPVYEIYYLIAGNRKFFIESEIYNISKGDMVFINKNVMHKSTYSSDKENERSFVRFNDNHIARLIEKFGRKEIEDCFKQTVFSIPMQRREYVGSIMRQLYNEYKNPDDFSYKTYGVLFRGTFNFYNKI